MIVTQVERTPQKTLPRARTNGRGGPGAYVYSMMPPLIPAKSPALGGGAGSEAVTRAPARVPESHSLRRLRHLELTRNVPGCQQNPRNLRRSRQFHHGPSSRIRNVADRLNVLVL